MVQYEYNWFYGAYISHKKPLEKNMDCQYTFIEYIHTDSDAWTCLSHGYLSGE